MGIQNVVDGHGLGIAITGMAVVFTGLVLVSLYLVMLPRVFEWADRFSRNRNAPATTLREMGARSSATSGLDPDLLAAITYVLQAERDRELALDDQRITLREDDEQRVWTAIGKMRSLATRL